MKNYWKPLLVIIVSAILYRFVSPFLNNFFINVLWIAILLTFGYFLSSDSKRNSRWLGKVIIAILIVFLVAFKLNIFVVSEFNDLLNFLGMKNMFLDLLLVYCGWAFFLV